MWRAMRTHAKSQISTANTKLAIAPAVVVTGRAKRAFTRRALVESAYPGKRNSFGVFRCGGLDNPKLSITQRVRLSWRS